MGGGPQVGGTNDRAINSANRYSDGDCTPPTSNVHKVGKECLAHVLKEFTEIDPQATIVSIDGVVAYDSISRKAMLKL